MTDETLPGPVEDPASAPISPAKSKPKGKIKARRLMPKDWLEIVQMARTGVPVAKIADSFKISQASIYAGLKDRRVTLGAYTPTSASFEESEDRQALMKRIRDTKQNDYQYTEFLQRQSIKLMMDATRDKKPLATTLDDQRAIDLAMKIIAKGTENKWKILGLDRDNQDADKELPELPIREMTNDEIVATRDQQLMDDVTSLELEEAARAALAEAEEDEDADLAAELDDEDAGAP